MAKPIIISLCPKCKATFSAPHLLKGICIYCGYNANEDPKYKQKTKTQ